MVTSAPTGGFKPMAIGGRVVRERERLQGMSAEERAWRKQWLKDQVLTEREPVTKYTWQNPVQNSFRRFYQKPLDVLIWKPLIPLMGYENAFAARFVTGKLLMATIGVFAGAYYFKYNAHNWSRKGGWNVYRSQTAVLPGDPGYPKASDRSKPQDYAKQGFEDCPI